MTGTTEKPQINWNEIQASILSAARTAAHLHRDHGPTPAGEEAMNYFARRLEIIVDALRNSAAQSAASQRQMNG